MKVLVIRFSSIGDIVLCTPIIRALKEQLKTEVHFLTKSAYANVLVNNPYIDRTIEWENVEIQQLKDESYDVIVDLHKNLRSKKVISGLRKPFYTFSKVNFQKWLLVNFKINRLPKMHIVDRYFEGMHALNIKNDRKGLDFFISKEVHYEALKEKFSLPDKYVVIALGAAHHTKEIPKQKIL